MYKKQLFNKNNTFKKEINISKSSFKKQITTYIKRTIKLIPKSKINSRNKKIKILIAYLALLLDNK